jgi:hypothetical protein
MSETDPLIDSLTKLAPSGLDRDALLFEAGRRSAPKSRLWPGVAGALACSQALMLAVWMLPKEPSSTQPSIVYRPDSSAETLIFTRPVEVPSENGLRAGSIDGAIPSTAPIPSEQFASSAPMLRAGSIHENR